MEKLRIAITLPDGQTIEAEPRPEDERRLAEVLSDRRTFQFTSSDDDLEGHAISTSITVDVEGHAMVMRLPLASDVAKVQRALVVGAITATLVGAGAIAVLQGPLPATTSLDQAPANAQVMTVPAMAMRAQQNEMAHEAALERANVPLDVNNPAVPAQALRAEQAEMAREQGLQDAAVAGSAAVQSSNSQVSQSTQLDANNPAVPAQADRAGTQ